MSELLTWIERTIEKRKEVILDANEKIWSYAELPYEERKSARLLCDILRSEGFEVEEGAADIPTSFVAVYKAGEGKPVAVRRDPPWQMAVPAMAAAISAW